MTHMNKCPKCGHRAGVVKPDPEHARLRRCELCWHDWIGLYKTEQVQMSIGGVKSNVVPTPYEEQRK